jgi:pimeloyl-ACP methyl ester carboxylesterase
LALRFLIRTYFPLSRMWAAAEAADEDVTAFAEEVPLALPRGAALERLQGVLLGVAEHRAHAAAAEREWQDAFFTPGAVGDLEAVERQRQRAMARYMATRWEFRFLRRKAPPVRFAPAGPERAEARFGCFRDDPSALFTPPSKPAIRQSRAIVQGGIRHRWLKFETPFADLGDTAWAHVYEPEGGFDHTVVMCHGLSIEADMWSGSLEMATHFADRRIRIIEPEAPWHGRRRPHGVYGGELFVAQGPFGAIEQFAAHVAEIACLVQWARGTGPGRVGIGGISLGALNSQLAVAHAREWPADMRPDAALLITTTDRLDDVAWFGGFAVGFGTARAYAEAGWNHDHLIGWQSLSAPVGEPGIDPGRIVVMLGRHDSVMPFEGARAFVERWRIPEANLFVKRRGHFTVPLGLARDRRPIERYLAVLNS